jgi:guanylate kinase
MDISQLLVIIGPSGSGKSTVVRTLADRGIVRVHPTWTTRPRRDDEGVGSPEHVFVTETEFAGLAARGFFIDTVTMFGLPFRYGLPPIVRSSDGRRDLVMLRAPLVARLARVYPDITVVQIEDTPRRTEARLRARGGSPADTIARLIDNERERSAGRAIADHVFVNDSTPGELADRITHHLGATVAA